MRRNRRKRNSNNLILMILLLVIIIIGILTFLGNGSSEQAINDYNKYINIIDNDLQEINVLISEESTLVNKINSASILNRAQYEQEYVNWAQRFANKAEIVQTHLDEFLRFIQDNEEKLKSAGINTVQLRIDINDKKILLRQTIESINANIKNFNQRSKSLEDLLLKILIGLS